MKIIVAFLAGCAAGALVFGLDWSVLAPGRLNFGFI